MKPILTRVDFEAAARELGIDPAWMRAIGVVESKRQGFDAKDRPAILFEPHAFSALTHHRHDGARCQISGAPGVVSRKNWAPGTYGSFGQQWIRLEAAEKLDRPAALMATSWGRFQQLGRDRYGWPNIETFVAAMHESEQQHLAALCAFLRGKTVKGETLVEAIRRGDVDGLAKGYNGRGYKRTGWDRKFRTALAEIKGNR
jgi:hypothetical protein